MFRELYDSISGLWSSRWPQATGEITAVDVEKVGGSHDTHLRLAVAYKFSLHDDGPYTGETFWYPMVWVNRRVLAAKSKILPGQPVTVRYRADDPCVNCLDRTLWQGL